MPKFVAGRRCFFLKIDERRGMKRADHRGGRMPERRGIARHPVRIRVAVRAPRCASPPAAAAGPAEGYFTRANLSAAVLVAHSPPSGAPGLVFLHLSAPSPGHAFAPLSATGLGFGQAGTTPEKSFCL